MYQCRYQSYDFYGCFLNVCQTPKEELFADCLFMYVLYWDYSLAYPKPSGSSVNVTFLPAIGVPASLHPSPHVLF